MGYLLVFIGVTAFFWTAMVLIVVALLAIVGAVIFRRRPASATPAAGVRATLDGGC
jgi:ABC-type xylose transport system permease subunit